MREHLRFVVSLALTLVVGACQPAAGGPDTAGDQARLRAGASLDAGAGAANGGGAAAQKCGATTCEKGSVCCNASCGICTEPGGVCIQLACDPGNAGKTCANTRCDAGESCMDTRGGPQCVAKSDDPCDLLDCPPNAVCKVVQGAATCVRVPADPGAVKDAGAGPVVTPGSCAVVLCAGICRDVPGGFICEPKPPVQGGASCAATTCLVGHVCDDSSGSAKCVPGSTCAATSCPVGNDCDDSSGVAKCVPAPSCAAVLCGPGTRCELKPVQCIRAPCPAQPTCVPVADDVCAIVRCKAGTHCEAKQVQCIRAPCPPVAECVPDSAGTACGKSTCTGDTFCCNASCGTCAPRGGACTQQICN